MSLLVCLIGADGLVLGTDSRGTFGDPRGVTAQNDLIKKLYLVNDRVGILVAGAGDLGSTVLAGFSALPGVAALGVTDLTMELHRYVRQQFVTWFNLFSIKATPADVRPTRPDLNFIVGGFESNNEPKIYRMSSSLDFAPMLHAYGFGVDGVAQYALYLLNRLYDTRASIEDLQYLAAYLITETASQDGKVGGPVQIAKIGLEASGVVSEEEVALIVEENKSRSQILKHSFLVRSKGMDRSGDHLDVPGSIKSRGAESDGARHQQVMPQRIDPPIAAINEVPDPRRESLSTVAEEMMEVFPPGIVW